MIIPSLLFSPQDKRMKQKDPMTILDKEEPMVVLGFLITKLVLRFFNRKNLIDLDVLQYL
jgi:hypothetical protein